MRGTLDHSNSFKETEIGPIPAEWEVVQMGAVSAIIVTEKVTNNDQEPMLLPEEALVLLAQAEEE